MDKHVLGLVLPTDPRWINNAEKNIEDILADHAWCEQKAASSCISLIVQYPEKRELVEALTPVVAEEWAHFERVLAELTARGYSLGRPRKDEYVARIATLVRKEGTRDEVLAEKLLLNALIEARSCERFRLLWHDLKDPGLQKFYYELMVSEAGHYKNFLHLAMHYTSEAYALGRWKEWLAEEAAIITTLEVRQDRMH